MQLIFLHSFQSPFYGGVGGRPDVHVVANEVEADTAPFFSQLGRSENVYAGTIQGGGSLWSGSQFIGYTHEFIDNAVRVICHEFAHTLGLPDGPPSLHGSVCTGYPNKWCEERYYYGTLNLMDQHRVRRSAIPPISTPHMANLPWREVVDFTGQNLFGVQLDDLMLGGKIYKYQLATDEMMLITYRAGNGVDGWLGADGLPALKSHGVEIWHVAGNGTIHDLESNMKLWNIGALVDPAVHTWEDAMAHPGLAEDPENGYDNYDLWLASDGSYRESGEYGEYAGDAGDFFPAVTGGGPAYVAYSWDTNPNCFGYSRQPEHANLFHRRRPQIEPSSLEVTIREIVGNGDAVIIDLVSAPFEVITYPDESVTEPFIVADTIPITWTTAYDTGDHTIALTLDLYYLPLVNNPALRWPIPGGQGIAATAVNQPFAWTVEATDPSPAAAILAVFHNEHSAHVCEVMSATFAVDGEPIPRELLLLPAAGAKWISGLDYQIRWTAAYDHSTFAGVSIEYRLDGTSVWYDLATDLVEGVGGYTYDAADDENYFAIIPDNSMATVNGQVRLRYEYHVAGGGTAVSYSNVRDGIAVYPVATRFADQTANIDSGYEGLPSSIAPVVTGAPGNDLGGVVIAIREANRPSQGELYFISTSPNGIELHLQFGYLQDSILSVGMTGLAVADYDGDGDDDIFACWPGDDGLSKLLTLNGSQYEEVNGQGVNPLQGIPAELLQNVQCAAWIDYDHDGELDLYVGRAIVQPGNPGDPHAVRQTPLPDGLFENDGGTFTEVGATVGLVDTLEFEVTRFAIWADSDQDGLWELVVGGDDRGYGTRHYREVGCRQFVVDATSPIHGTSLSDARWVDIDNDGILDVVGLTSGGVVVFRGQAGGTLESQEVLAAIGHGGSFAVLDYDLDGWRDLIVKSGGPSSFALLANFLCEPMYPHSFVDISAAVGILGSSTAIVAFPSDLDQDGDFDLLIGRDNCSVGTLLANELRDPISGGSQHYVTLRLISGVPSGAYGATVILRNSSSDLIGIQVVEGGGNRESQANRDLVFGLGNYNGPLTAEIHWPRGRVQTYNNVPTNQLVTITEPVSFAIDEDSVEFSLIVGLGGAVMWQFEWATDNWTAAALDEVTIVGVPGSCIETTTTLRPGDPDIEHAVTYTVTPNGSGIYYQHRLTHTNAPCYPNCVIQYSVGSDNGVWMGLVQSVGHTGRMPKICPLSQ